MDFLQRLFNPLAYIGGTILALLGLAPVNATQWLTSHLSPDAVSWVSSDRGRWAFVFIAVVIYGNMWRRHLTRMEVQAAEARKQRPPALLSPLMSITDIAAYLRDRSSWGWMKLRELKVKSFVGNDIPDELRRAARSGEVRFIGTGNNDGLPEEIAFSFWDSAMFDRNGLWSIQYETFTMPHLARHENVMRYRFGRAPQDDVLQIWPPASLWLRIRVRIFLWFWRIRRRIPAEAMN
jgi:hypothetical protein